MARAVFLNHLGTLVRDEGPILGPGDVRLVKGAASAIASLRGLGLHVVVAANQSSVAFGRCGEADIDSAHERIAELVHGNAGVMIDRFYYCPFDPEGTVERYKRDHPWRLPNPGMLLQAADDLGLDLGASWMIGRTAEDLQSARAVSMRSVLVVVGGEEDGVEGVEVDLRASNLIEAVRLIAQQPRRSRRKVTTPIIVEEPIRAATTLVEVGSDEEEMEEEVQVMSEGEAEGEMVAARVADETEDSGAEIEGGVVSRRAGAGIGTDDVDAGDGGDGGDEKSAVGVGEADGDEADEEEANEGEAREVRDSKNGDGGDAWGNVDVEEGDEEEAGEDGGGGELVGGPNPEGMLRIRRVAIDLEGREAAANEEAEDEAVDDSVDEGGDESAGESQGFSEGERVGGLASGIEDIEGVGREGADGDGSVAGEGEEDAEVAERGVDGAVMERGDEQFVGVEEVARGEKVGEDTDTELAGAGATKGKAIVTSELKQAEERAVRGEGRVRSGGSASGGADAVGGAGRVGGARDRRVSLRGERAERGEGKGGENAELLRQILAELKRQGVDRGDFSVLRMTAYIVLMVTVLCVAMALMLRGDSAVFMQWMAGAVVSQLVMITLLLVDGRK